MSAYLNMYDHLVSYRDVGWVRCPQNFGKLPGFTSTWETTFACWSPKRQHIDPRSGAEFEYICVETAAMLLLNKFGFTIFFSSYIILLVLLLSFVIMLV